MGLHLLPKTGGKDYFLVQSTRHRLADKLPTADQQRWQEEHATQSDYPLEDASSAVADFGKNLCGNKNGGCRGSMQ